MIKASEGELAVVTGAAGGLGACFATKLAQRGYRLLLIDRREEQLRQLCETLTSRDGVAAEPLAVTCATGRRSSRWPGGCRSGPTWRCSSTTQDSARPIISSISI